MNNQVGSEFNIKKYNKGEPYAPKNKIKEMNLINAGIKDFLPAKEKDNLILTENKDIYGIDLIVNYLFDGNKNSGRLKPIGFVETEAADRWHTYLLIHSFWKYFSFLRHKLYPYFEPADTFNIKSPYSHLKNSIYIKWNEPHTNAYCANMQDLANIKDESYFNIRENVTGTKKGRHVIEILPDDILSEIVTYDLECCYKRIAEFFLKLAYEKDG